LVDDFTSGMKSHLMTYLLGGSAHIYIGFETLKVKCTQFVVKRPSRIQEQRFICFRRGGQLFSGGFEKIMGGG
jgi:hypothetical protein